MNKRELIEHINNILFDNLKDTLFTESTLSITESAKDNKVTITFETEQGGVLVGGMLKKFKKVTIPQFVADWIEHTKKEDYHIFGAIQATESDDKLDDWIWNDDNMEVFARAWLDGYTVGEEKRYLVKVIGVSRIYECLNFDTTENRWKFFDCDNTKAYRTHHTRKELEQAGFGWVFDCPGIEIEEVKG